MIRPTDRHDCPNCQDDGRPHRQKMRPAPVGGVRSTNPPIILMAWECDCGSHLPAEPLVIYIDERAIRRALYETGGRPPVVAHLLEVAAQIAVAPFQRDIPLIPSLWEVSSHGD